MYPNFESIMINLGTDAIFIVIVLLGVDRIIERKNSEKWVEVDKIIKFKLNRIMAIYIASLKTNFGYGDDIMNLEELKSLDPYRIHNEGIKALKNTILPEIVGNCDNLTPDNINYILNDLESIHMEIDYLFNLSISRLKPEVIENLLKVQEFIEPTVKLARNDHPFFDSVIPNKNQLFCSNLINIGKIFLKLDET